MPSSTLRSLPHDTNATVLLQEAVEMAGLHVCRTINDLDHDLSCKLVRLLPSTDLGLLLLEGEQHRVQIAIGAGCPWQPRDLVDPFAWHQPDERRLPVQYRGGDLGMLVVGSPIPDEVQPLLFALLTHYGVALVNLTLGDEAQHAVQHYCASLQALEEGIVLLQETDPETITARLLALASSMLRATAGALYVLTEVGNSESPLQLAQTMGIPEHLLNSFDGDGGGTWPQRFQQQQTFHADRSFDPTLGGLDPEHMPPMLQNLVSLPLRYAGVQAGLLVLFNVAPESGKMRDHLERMDNFGQLSAALLHRLKLEAATVHQKSMAKELQIAAAIQQRLLPTRPPDTDAFEFAWRSLSANHIGGDYLDLLVSERGDLYAVIADAAGHGINSALLMSSFRSTYRADAPWQEPEGLCASLNQVVHDEVGPTGMFITAATLRIECGTNHLTITSAGHNPVLWYRAATGTLQQIDAHGPPLGFSSDATFGSEQHQFASGDVLLLYTDGVSESTNAELDMFGDDRVVELLRRHAGDPAEHLLTSILQEMGTFTGRSRYDDDVSLLVIKAR